MSVISIPVSKHQKEFIDSYIEKGNAANETEVFRQALRFLEEKEAIDVVLRAQKEPDLKGDLRYLMKKIV